jgi:hypothetical protein
VNVVLVGQPELAGRLNDPKLRQFKQRVVLRCSLPPLDFESTVSYIASRLRVAGAVPSDVFTKDAVRAIYEASRGIPRTIGVVCENALLAGYAAQQKPIVRAIVADACRALDLPVCGGAAREDVAAADPVAAAPEPVLAAAPRPVPPERRAKHHFWTSSRAAEPPPASAAVAGSEAAVVKDRTRIFDFF